MKKRLPLAVLAFLAFLSAFGVRAQEDCFPCPPQAIEFAGWPQGALCRWEQVVEGELVETALVLCHGARPGRSPLPWVSPLCSTGNYRAYLPVITQENGQ